MSRGKIVGVFEKLQTLWSILGITFVLTVALELVLGFAVPARPGAPLSANRTAYPDEPWVDGFLRETSRSAAVTWTPYVYWERLPFEGDYVNVDVNRRRVTWHPVDLPPSRPEVTVFMFGGSTMWGSGARDAYTIPSQLSKLLDAAGIRAKVVNFGEQGYVSTQEIIALLLQLQRGARPDLVVFYDGVNDAFSTYQNGAAGWPQNESRRRAEFNLLASRRRLLKTTLGVGLERSALARVLPQRPSAGDAAGAHPDDPETMARDTLAIYRANVALAEALGREWGFETAFFWQPAVFTKNHLTELERLEQERFEYLSELYRRLSRRVGADERLDAVDGFVDLSALFADEREQRFVDFCHTSESANAVIAAAIFDHLEWLGWLSSDDEASEPQGLGAPS